MSVPSFTNSMGYATQPVGVPDWVGSQLYNESYKDGTGYPKGPYFGASSNTWRPPTPYVRWITNMQTLVQGINRFSFIEHACNGGSGTVAASSCGGHFSFQAGVFDGDHLAEAEVKALNKLGGNNAQLGEYLGDGKRTIHHLAETATSLWKFYKAIKRGNLAGAGIALGLSKKRVLTGGFAAKRWLEYQYAWKPLLSDIYGTYKEIHDLFHEKPMLMYAKSGSRYEYRGEYTGSLEGSWTALEKTMVRIDAAVDNASKVRVASQLGLSNPLSIGWEILPFSFLFDWSYPIGNVLQAVSATTGLTFAGGSKSQSMEGSSTLTRTALYFPTDIVLGSEKIDKLYMARSPYGGFPIPKPYKVDNPLSSLRVANAAALFRSCF